MTNKIGSYSTDPSHTISSVEFSFDMPSFEKDKLACESEPVILDEVVCQDKLVSDDELVCKNKPSLSSKTQSVSKALNRNWNRNQKAVPVRFSEKKTKAGIEEHKAYESRIEYAFSDEVKNSVNSFNKKQKKIAHVIFLLSLFLIVFFYLIQTYL